MSGREALKLMTETQFASTEEINEEDIAQRSSDLFDQGNWLCVLA
jgi:hypothetical protein